jgi:hypothetical protein
LGRITEVEVRDKPTEPPRQIDAKDRLSVGRQNDVSVGGIEIPIGVAVRIPDKVHKARVVIVGNERRAARRMAL